MLRLEGCFDGWLGSGWVCVLWLGRSVLRVVCVGELVVLTIAVLLAYRFSTRC